MSGDMSLVVHDVINSVLGPELRAEWEDERLNLGIRSFKDWKRAWGPWKQSGWVSKRVAVASASRVETEGARALAQPPNPTPTMAMSLDQPLTVAAPTNAVETAEPVDQPMTPEQSREHATELTRYAALVKPINSLTLDTDTIT